MQSNNQSLYTLLENQLENEITSFGLHIISKSMSPTPENPFILSRIRFTNDWLLENMTDTDYQTLEDISELSEYGRNLLLFHEHYNQKGVHLETEYHYYENCFEEDFTFLMKYGNAITKEKYSLVELFSDDINHIQNSIDKYQFRQDVEYTLKRVAKELSEILTKIVTPLYQRIMTHIEDFKEQLRSNG